MSNNNTAANPTVPETSGDLPFKLDVRVRPIAPMGNLLAYANVTIGDCFKIDGFRICSSEKGLYVNMPSTQDNKGNWRVVLCQEKVQIKYALLMLSYPAKASALSSNAA